MPDKKYDVLDRVWFKKVNDVWCYRTGDGKWTEVTTSDISFYIYPAENIPNGVARVSFEFPLETELGSFQAWLQIRLRHGMIEYAGFAMSDDTPFKDYVEVQEFWMPAPE